MQGALALTFEKVKGKCHVMTSRLEQPNFISGFVYEGVLSPVSGKFHSEASLIPLRREGVHI